MGRDAGYSDESDLSHRHLTTSAYCLRGAIQQHRTSVALSEPESGSALALALGPDVIRPILTKLKNVMRAAVCRAVQV